MTTGTRRLTAVLAADADLGGLEALGVLEQRAVAGDRRLLRRIAGDARVGGDRVAHIFQRWTVRALELSHDAPLRQADPTVARLIDLVEQAQVPLLVNGTQPSSRLSAA